jgi:hypothetical protein
MPDLYAGVRQSNAGSVNAYLVCGQKRYDTVWVVEWTDRRQNKRVVVFRDYGLAHSYRTWHNDWIHKILQTRNDPQYHDW